MTVSLSSNCVCIQGVVQKFPGTRCLSGEEPACQCRRHRRRGFDPWVGKIRLSRKWQPAPVFLPGKFHGQKNLVGYSPWGCKESNTTEQILSSKITADGDCSHEIKRCLLLGILGRKVMSNLVSVLKSRDIILPTKVCLVKAMVFSVVMYGCESWTIKKAED